MMLRVVLPAIQLVFLSQLLVVHSFVTFGYTKSSHLGMVLEPLFEPAFMDVSIALLSAAAGAASQFPRIKELERELTITKKALTESELELVAKITELEEKLYRMDQEFEAQTDKVKKRYDESMKLELKKVAEKVKKDYRYTLDIRLAEQRQDLLTEKLTFVNNLNGDKEVELVNLRLRQGQINNANKKLEDALTQSKLEIEKLSELTKKKSVRWPF